MRLFASLREAVGTTEIVLDLPDGATAEEAWEALARDHAGVAERRARLTAAVNRRYAAFDTPLRDGDEVVFVPPVSGG
ncbi:MAG TPA: molybdopterin converting factor subunit 1 [Vicinamibacteria bacterium]|nr:molybdopterin converting factor subunit 1 [Vicinamibacteria bacterium]